MVKERAGNGRPGRRPRERVPVRGPGPLLEALETRLESGLVFPHVPFGPLAGPGALGGLPGSENLCGCLGTLCLCDGWDCAGICQGHCVLDYT